MDTFQNGEGCEYRTTAHRRDYHDYSTGFRCCRDVAADLEQTVVPVSAALPRPLPMAPPTRASRTHRGGR
jgi:hypothetical protein